MNESLLEASVEQKGSINAPVPGYGYQQPVVAQAVGAGPDMNRNGPQAASYMNPGGVGLAPGSTLQQALMRPGVTIRQTMRNPCACLCCEPNFECLLQASQYVVRIPSIYHCFGVYV